TGTAGGALTNSSSSPASLGGNVTLTFSPTLDTTIGGSGNITLNGVVSGGFDVTKTGSNTLVLANAGNTFGGSSHQINLQAGTLSVASNGALGNVNTALSLGGGTLQTTASFSTARAVGLGVGTNSFDVAGGTTL